MSEVARLLDAADEIIATIGDSWDADRREGPGIDFKETPATTGRNAGRHQWKAFYDGLAETAVCLANADGGCLVIGVRNKALSRMDALPGVPDTCDVPEIVDAIFSRTSPPITLIPAVREVEGRRLILAVVRPTGSVHCTTSGVYKIRLNNKCQPLHGEQLRGLQSLRGQYDWTAGPSGVSTSELSRAALERASVLLQEKGHDDLAQLAEAQPEEFCRARKLIASDGSLTRAAVLLFGNAGALRAISEWGVNVQARESAGSDPQILIRRDESEQPLVLLLDHLLSTVRTLTKVQTIRVGARQIELRDYPLDALREVFANAFAHRDWEVPGVVEIVHSPDELVVSSPGGLLPTLRADRLLHDATASRNRLLADNFAKMHLAEMSGLGLDRAFREMARLGKEPPKLEDGPRFRVTMPGGRGDEAFARYVHGADFPGSLSNDLDVLMIATALRHRKSLDADGLVSRLQRPPEAIERVLRRMADSLIVQPTKATSRRSHPKYGLTPKAITAMGEAVSYRTRSIDQDDRKIIAHLLRHSRITNEDVRNYLDCDTATARNRLSRFRSLGLITLDPSGRKKGPTASWIPTQKFGSEHRGRSGRPPGKSKERRPT
ncbi:MAG: ATP-binding protein [Candidatus Nanopelagicales bacterium]|nr:ATP-binding protein [Candidatus Nanopelagicales bacterium]